MLRPRREAFLLALALVAGCAGDPASSTVFQPVGQTTKLRVVNAAATDLFVVWNGATVSGAIPFGNGAGCLGVDSRNPKLGVRYGITTTLYQGVFADNENAFVVASTYDSSGTTQYQVMRVPADTATGSQARVRVVNVSGEGPLDAYITPVDAPLDAPDASDVDTGELENAVDVTPGEWRVRLTQAGTQTVEIDLGNRTFEQFRRELLIVAPPDTGDSVVRSFFWSTGCP